MSLQKQYLISYNFDFSVLRLYENDRDYVSLLESKLFH